MGEEIPNFSTPAIRPGSNIADGVVEEKARKGEREIAGIRATPVDNSPQDNGAGDPVTAGEIRRREPSRWFTLHRDLCMPTCVYYFLLIILLFSGVNVLVGFPHSPVHVRGVLHIVAARVVFPEISTQIQRRRPMANSAHTQRHIGEVHSSSS